MIKTERAADAVARHLETLIVEGTLRPGQRLLAERDLAQRLDVSRPTLRDGLKILQDKGLLDNGDGRGMRVARLGAAAIADPLLALLAARPDVAEDYLEFRDIVESQAAALAAQRATGTDRDRIADCLTQIDAAHQAADPAAEADADAALHLAIYEASHNVVVLQIMRALSANLRSDVSKNRARLFTLPAIRDVLRDQHRAIAQAILDGTPDAARQAAHDHLTYIRQAARDLAAAQGHAEVALRRSHSGGVGQPAT